MVWTRLDDQFWQHPKVIGLSNAAFRLYVSALNWSVTHLQDGHVIPVTVAIALPQATKKQRESAASELVAGGLWYANGSGWVIHDFADYQESSEDVAARRDIWRRKQSMRRDPELSKALKARDKNKCRYCGETVDWKDRKGQLGGTYDHVVPLSDSGDDSLENLVVACRGCNTKKGNRSPEESGLTLRQIPARKSGGNLGGIKSVSGHPNPNPIPKEAPKGATQQAIFGALERMFGPVSPNYKSLRGKVAFGLLALGATPETIEEYPTFWPKLWGDSTVTLTETALEKYWGRLELLARVKGLKLPDCDICRNRWQVGVTKENYTVAWDDEDAVTWKPCRCVKGAGK